MAFTIYLIYHSHIDIGYTDRQERIAMYQADFIRSAVDLALSEKQKHRTEESKFKFTAEGFWAVEQFLKRYGEEGKERLCEAVRSGCFELTAGYAHFADILDDRALAASLEPCSTFVRTAGLPAPVAAMSADVNGFSYSYPDRLADAGVRYLSVNINTHHGGTAFGKPLVPFYWKAPSSRRILVWNGLTYHKANLLGIIPGVTPMGDPGVPGLKPRENGFAQVRHPDDYAAGMLFELVQALREDGYPYSFLPIMGSGLYTDNSPVEDFHCDFIEEWNREYGEKIEIRTATLYEFFSRLEKEEIPEYSGEWTDWWTDGVACMPRELALYRNAQRTLRKIGLFDPDRNVVTEKERSEIVHKMILFAEHTWGHSHGLTNCCDFGISQLDLRKASFAVEADLLASAAYDRVLRALGEGEFTARRPFEYDVVNPFDREIISAVALPTDFWEEDRFSACGAKVAVRDGETLLPAQRRFTTRGSETVAVVRLAPRERKRLTIEFGRTVPPHGQGLCGDAFENEYYRLDFGNGGVRLYDRSDGSELVGEYALGCPVYQIFPKGERHLAAGFGYSARKQLPDRKFVGRLKGIEVKETGDVFTLLRAEYDVEGATSYSVEYRLYRELSSIEMTVNCVKTLELDPEGMYIALLSATGEREWRIDKSGELFRPGDQIPGSCFDYYSADRGFFLTDGRRAVTVNALDAPLVTFGGLKLWQFNKSIRPVGTAFTWLTNNKWETNFRAQCSGCLQSRYIIDFTEAKTMSEVMTEHDSGVVVLRK